MIIKLTENANDRPVWVNTEAIIQIAEYKGGSQVICSHKELYVKEKPDWIMSKANPSPPSPLPTRM